MQPKRTSYPTLILEPGAVYRDLTVIGLDHINRYRFYRCLCVCGTETVVRGDRLRSGATQSCGCARAAHGRSLTTHGHSRASNGNPSPTYMSWRSMRMRCTDERVNGYHNYGGRGISVCDRWLGSFAAFLEDMGERPAAMTLDRVDVNGNYEPSNCRWADQATQRANRRRKGEGR